MNEKLVGNFRIGENDCLIGWAHDPAAPDASVQCEIQINGHIVDTIIADHPRSDLRDKLPHTRVGLSIDLSGHKMFEYGAEISIRDAKNGKLLPPSPVVVPAPLKQSIAPSLNLAGKSTVGLTIEETFHGWMILNRHDNGVDQELLKFGEYALSEIEVFKCLIQSSDGVLDVGANIGALSLSLSKHVPDGKVYAFEPQKNVYFRLCGNVALNGITNVVPMNTALGDYIGRAWIPTLDYTSYHASGGVRVSFDQTGDEIEITRIDALELDGGKIALIKIDVEGNEPAVLRGGTQLIKRDSPAIYFECRSENDYREIQRQLLPLGYKFFWHPAPLFRSDNFRGEQHDHYFGSGINSNILAIAKPYPLNFDHLGLYPSENIDEFWPISKFPKEWQEKISGWHE